MDDKISGFGLFLYMFPATLVTLLGAAVVSTLWGWFAVPALGVPAIGVIEAFGFYLIVRAFRGFSVDSPPLTHERALQGFGVSISGALFLLASGYVLQLFL
jgi:hypothetical protein